MQILVVSATQHELAPFLSQSSHIDHLITGVGSPACMYQLAKKLQQKKYDVVIQAGIAGTFGARITLVETVLVQKEAFADLGVLEQNQLKSMFDMQWADKNEWPYKETWLVNDYPFLAKSALKKVSAVTVNMVSDDLNFANLYVQKYNADIESMEGAAFHYVCLQENVNFIQLRTISNRVGERDKSKWKMKEAIENLNKELFEIIKELAPGK
ncbi:MAG TPA: futalosine hydrolase [Ferruginibacter sp.]|nr:futalosine hydrolase [Ferruginibacter sp.]